MTNPNGLTAQVVHAIPGRIRLRVPALKRHPDLAEQILAAGMAHPGVRRIRVNLACECVVVEGDSPTLGDLATNGLLHRWLTHNSSNSHQESKAPALSKARRFTPLGLALSAVGLTFFGGGIARLLALGAAVAGGLPIFRRAAATFATERRLCVDHLDSTAVGLMAILGDVRGAAFMIAMISLGDEIRERTARRSRRAALDLHTALGRTTWLVEGRSKRRVPVERLRVEDVVVVYPGELVPVDGVVVDGYSAVDQKSLTGESQPVLKQAGDRIWAGTVLADGKLYVRAEAVGDATRAGWIVKTLEQAPVIDVRAASYAHRFADRLVVPTFALAGLSLAATGSLARAAAIVIVDFATGIRVSAPTAVLAAMTRLAHEGILIKGGRSIEQLATANVVIFDKTGTLTLGEPDVCEIVSLDERFPPNTVLALAGAAEERLRHPTAWAIVQHARKLGVTLPERTNLRYAPGLGVAARVDGRRVHVGSARFLEQEGVRVEVAQAVGKRLRAAGASAAFVAVDGVLAGAIAYRDPVRPESATVVAWLRAHGVSDVLMVTGDEPSVARPIAAALGIERVHAGALPDEKVAIVKEWQRRGRVVAVVGDGINDSPAFALADVSISLSNGADVAREVADVVLLEPSLLGFVQAIELARQCTDLIRQNFLVVGVPNLAAIAFAIAGHLTPVGATLLNNGSTIVAAMNSLRPLRATNGHAAGRVNGAVHESGHENGRDRGRVDREESADDNGDGDAGTPHLARSHGRIS